jgi:ribose 5-phosphate isomerase A
MAKAKAGPVVTDNGNFVIDAPFDEDRYKDPYSLLAHIKMLTGVVEVGLFCGMAKAAYFGNQVSQIQSCSTTFQFNADSILKDGSVTIKWSDGKQETLQESDVKKAA